MSRLAANEEIMGITTVAEEVQCVAMTAAVRHGMKAITITVDESGGFQLRAPAINRSVAVGVLTRAMLMLAAEMDREGGYSGGGGSSL